MIIYNKYIFLNILLIFIISSTVESYIHIDLSDAITQSDNNNNNNKLLIHENYSRVNVKQSTRSGKLQKFTKENENLVKLYTDCPVGFSGVLPYLYDCRQFINCWKGRKQLQTCAPGTLFNSKSNECDTPDKVDCATYDRPYNQRQTTKQKLNYNYESDEDEYNDDKVTEVKVECEKDATGIFAHPNNCLKFLHCDRGRTFIKDCPPGTAFNTKISLCDWPYNVNCDKLNNYNSDKLEYDSLSSSSTINEPSRVLSPPKIENPNINIRPFYTHQSTTPTIITAQYEHSIRGTNGSQISRDLTPPKINYSPIYNRPIYVHQTTTQKINTALRDNGLDYNRDTSFDKTELLKGRDRPQPQHQQAQIYPVYAQTVSRITPTTKPTLIGPPTTTTMRTTVIEQNPQMIEALKLLFKPVLKTSLNKDLNLNFTNTPIMNITGIKDPLHTASTTPKTNEKLKIEDMELILSGEQESLNQGVNNHNYSYDSEEILSHNNNNNNINKTLLNNPTKKFLDENTESIHVHNSQCNHRHSHPVHNPAFHHNHNHPYHHSHHPHHPHHSFNHTQTFHTYHTPTQHNQNSHHFFHAMFANKHLTTTTPQTTTQSTTTTARTTTAATTVATPSTTISITRPIFENLPPTIFDEEVRFFHDIPPFTQTTSLEELDVPMQVLPSPVEPTLDTIFDCENERFIPEEQVCDGVDNCGNRFDEKNCEHIGYQIRLSSDTGRSNEGRVEVSVYGKWGYICDDKFDNREGDILCKELGFADGVSELRLNSYYSPNINLTTDADNSAIFLMDDLDCVGNETSLKDCKFSGWGVHDCNKEELVGIVCKTPTMTCPENFWLCKTSQECIPFNFICDHVPDCGDQSDEDPIICNATIQTRLVDGTSNMEGRLEIKYRGVWGTVCDDDFGLEEATVACRSLGYGGHSLVIKQKFGPGKGPILLDQVNCIGNEMGIDECSHWQWGENNCAHSEDVGIRCSSGIVNNPKFLGRKGGRVMNHISTTTDNTNFNNDLSYHGRSAVIPKECGKIKIVDDGVNYGTSRVISGNVVVRGTHPWQVTLRNKAPGNNKSFHWCGGVLISEYHILTAAHCVATYPKGRFIVRLGDHHTDVVDISEIDVNIENIYIHEKFNNTNGLVNDIALILLKTQIRFNDFIQPICLPPKGAIYRPNMNCTISGWGSTQSGKAVASLVLRSGMVPIISDKICKQKEVYGDSITDGMFCAGSLNEGIDACDGDSGGPLVCGDDKKILYGIISWGQHCGYANKPGVYVKVTKFIDWINDKLNHSMHNFGV